MHYNRPHENEVNARRITDIYRIIRGFLLGTFNREFLIFLFFLVLSAAYWFMSVLNDTIERDITLTVQITGLPRNAIILGDEVQEVRATVRDKGYTLAAYTYGDHLPPVKVPFATYARRDDRCVVSGAELAKLIAAQLYASTKVLAVKPERLEFAYNYGLNRRVPVRLLGTVRPADTYYLSRVSFQPESVSVYASPRHLDSIAAVYTERQSIHNFSDTIRRRVALRHIASVKMIPSEVTMTLYPDIMIEAVAMVPVTAINVPEGCVLRTFPPQVQVRYVIGATQYNHIDTSRFTVVADYTDTDGGTSEKCLLRLVKAPREARSPVLQTPQVDYLVERNQ